MDTYVHTCNTNVVEAGHFFKRIVKSHVSLQSVLLNAYNLYESKPILVSWKHTVCPSRSSGFFFSPLLPSGVEQNNV